jgi:hypothetical protein
MGCTPMRAFADRQSLLTLRPKSPLPRSMTRSAQRNEQVSSSDPCVYGAGGGSGMATPQDAHWTAGLKSAPLFPQESEQALNRASGVVRDTADLLGTSGRVPTKQGLVIQLDVSRAEKIQSTDSARRGRRRRFAPRLCQGTIEGVGRRPAEAVRHALREAALGTDLPNRIRSRVNQARPASAGRALVCDLRLRRLAGAVLAVVVP